jgi:hypothetical protein
MNPQEMLDPDVRKMIVFWTELIGAVLLPEPGLDKVEERSRKILSDWELGRQGPAEAPSPEARLTEAWKQLRFERARVIAIEVGKDSRNFRTRWSAGNTSNNERQVMTEESKPTSESETTAPATAAPAEPGPQGHPAAAPEQAPCETPPQPA